jgi:hypothetical protein
MHPAPLLLQADALSLGAGIPLWLILLFPLAGFLINAAIAFAPLMEGARYHWWARGGTGRVRGGSDRLPPLQAPGAPEE